MISHILFIIFLLLCLIITQSSIVSGIRCHCDFCPSSKNRTCETDGYCLSLTWKQEETGIVHHAYRCLDRKRFVPPNAPAQCFLSNVPNIKVRTACCSGDMCNLHLTPVLTTQDLSDEGNMKRPRDGTKLVSNKRRLN